MKVALLVCAGRISPVLDVNQEALILTIEGGAISARRLDFSDGRGFRRL